ncbi:response regulator [Streptomyces sp. NRRL F-5727]|uniref:response regulator n=1 Tax=Streptomyces sp. NRRL F-5727 TaxID=1463871 RepID=UPI0004C80190|nr:response regulator transcription factor [Streptomyces sp. NRRL F-5727]
MTAGPVRLLLVDDQPLIRAGLRLLAAEAPDLDVVGEAADGATAVALAEETRPDVVLMDVRMPGMDGIEATRLITTGPSGARVLVLTTFDDDENVYGALRAGASGFLVKDMDLDDILGAVRVVAGGDALIAPAVTSRLIAAFARQPDPARTTPARATPAPRPLPEAVTDREREVLTLVGRGLSNHEIARELFISPATAKTHVARLLSRLAARDRVHLVILAYEFGLVAPSG